MAKPALRILLKRNVQRLHEKPHWLDGKRKSLIRLNSSFSLRQELTIVRRAIVIAEKYSSSTHSEKSEASQVEINELASNLSRVDAIRYVMQQEPEKWWRGIELAKELMSKGYGREIKYFDSKISTDLKSYSLEKNSRPAIFSKRVRNQNPEYRLAQRDFALE